MKSKGQTKVGEQNEIKPIHEKKEKLLARITHEVEVHVKEGKGIHFLHEVIGKIGLDDEKKGVEQTNLVELLLKKNLICEQVSYNTIFKVFIFFRKKIFNY